MSLQVKNKVTPNNSNRNVVFSETTGVYSGTNPGGYGASQSPTGYRSVSDIGSSNLEFLTYNGTLNFNGGSTPDVVGSIYATSYIDTDARNIANGTSQTIDLGTLVPNDYVDSVYKSVYYNWFNGIDMVTRNDDTTLLVPDTNEFIGASYIEIITGIDIHSIYEVVSVNSTTFSIVVNGVLPDMTTAIYRVGYSSTSYFANTYDINKCLHGRVAKLAVSSCTCNNKCTEKLFEAVMLYMSIQPNIDLGKYQKAQEIITYLTNYCNDGCCNC